MEQNSSSRTAIFVPKDESNDWRTEFTSVIRSKIVRNILGNSRLPPDALTQRIEVVQNFVENMFRNARSKEEFKQKINRGLKLTGDNYHHLSADVSSPRPGQNPTSMAAGGGQSSTLKSAYEAPFKLAGYSAEQGMQSNISANKQSDIPGTQPSQKAVYQQQSEHQFLKHNVHQPNVDTLRIEDICSGHHHHQQLIVSQSNPLQFAQNQTLPTESWQPPFTEQSGTALFLTNQPVAQGDNIGQQLSPFRETIPNTFQQPDGLQRNSSCLQQQHRVIGPELKAMNMKSHEHSAHILQVKDTSLQPKDGQRVQSVNNFHQLSESKLKVLPSQKTISHVSSALSPVTSLLSATPSEQANMAGLRDQMYQELLSMKEYLPWLTCLYNKLIEKYQKPIIPEIYKRKIGSAERLIKYLSMSRDDLVQCSMKILETYQKAAKKFFNPLKREILVSSQQYTQLQPPGGQSPMPQLQQHSNGEQNFHPVNLVEKSKPVGPSPLSSTQQVVLSSQPNMMNSSRSGSLMELKQQNAPSSFQHAARSEGHDFAGTQQIKYTTGRSFNSAENLQQQNSVINAFPQQRQLKHQMMQPQISRLDMQLQLSQSRKKTKHKQMANIQTVTTSDMLQQDPFVSQLSDYSHHMPLPATPRHFHSTSQMSQHSSSRVYQKNLPLSKAGTPPSQTSSSPTRLTPFSIPEDYKEHPSDASPLLIHENFKPPKFLPVAQPVISAPILQTESASPNDNQQSFATKDPLKCLLKAVQSLSPKVLSASVSEIGLALKMVDVISGTASNDSRADVHENLTSETWFCIHGRNFSSQCGCSFADKMKSKTNAIALDETDIFKKSTSQIWDLDSNEASRIKRHRIEPGNTLLDEIKCINQRLLETVINLESTKDPAALDAGEGTIVRFVYSAVAFNENLKSQIALQMLPLSLQLFVPASYPNASPVILGGLSFDGSGESKELIVSEKTRSRFSLSLHKLSEPMSLTEMAMTWDNCARTVLLECAQSVGGGCFSSKYGKWEKCVAALSISLVAC